MEDLEIVDLTFDSKLDNDGHCEIKIESPFDDLWWNYINKDQAKQIIEHLTKLFKLDLNCDNLCE